MVSPFSIVGPAHGDLAKGLVAPKRVESAIESVGMEHFRLLLDNVPVAMAMFDLEMRYLLANSRWVEDFKLAEVELVGRSHYELFPMLHPGWRHVYERALQGQVVKCDRDAMMQNGRPMVYRWEVRPWRNADTRIGGIMISCSRLQAPLPDEATASTTNSTPSLNESGAATDGMEAMWMGRLPMLAVDVNGRILRASCGASTFLLPKGLEEGVTSFWEVLGERSGQGALRERVEQVLQSVLAEGRAQEVIRTSLSTDEEATSEVPAHWLFTPMGEPKEGQAAVALVVGLEGVPMLPPVQVPLSLSISAAEAPLMEARGEAMEIQRRLAEAADAEKLSRQRESRLRSVLDLAPCGLLVLDEKGRLIFQNARLRHLLGREVMEGQRVDEWLILGCRDAVHAREVARRWQEDIWRRQLVQVLTLVSMDDLLKDIEIRPVALPGGGMMLMLQDVTEMRRGEEMLRSTEAKFRTLVHENPLPVVLTDRSGAVFDANPAAEVLLGHPRAELRRMRLNQWMDEASVKRRAEVLEGMNLCDASSGELEALLPLANGSVAKVAMRVALVMDVERRALFTVHFMQELESKSKAKTETEEKAEAQVQAEPQVRIPVEKAAAEFRHPLMLVDRFQEMEDEEEESLESEQVELLSTDAHGRVASWTEEATEIFGFAKEEILGRGLHLLFRPSDATGFCQDLAKHHALAFGGKVVEWTFYHKVHGRSVGSFVLNAVGDSPLAVQLKLKQKQKVAATVGVDAEEVDVDLDHAMEQQRVVIGETHQRVKDQLQIINSMLNLQLNTLRNEEARHALRSSQNRIGSIAALHHHLSRMAAGEEMNFKAFVAGLIERLRECFDVPAGRVHVEIDLSKKQVPEKWLLPLSLALNEMVSNVFKHAFPGDRIGVVEVALHWNGEMGALSVVDDGIGFAADFDDHHHEGMGLKILRVFAGQLGGEIKMNHGANGGAEVVLQFPVKRA